MSFDAVAYTEALERPEVVLPRGLFGRLVVRFTNLFRSEARKKTVRKKTYRARILSAQEFERHRARFAALGDEGMDTSKGEKYVKDFLTDLRIPWDKVFRLPGPAQKELIESFFVFQAKANGIEDVRPADAWNESRAGPETTRRKTTKTGRS